MSQSMEERAEGWLENRETFQFQSRRDEIGSLASLLREVRRGALEEAFSILSNWTAHGPDCSYDNLVAGDGEVFELEWKNKDGSPVHFRCACGLTAAERALISPEEVRRG